MRTYQYLDIATEQATEDCLTTFALDRAGKQLHTHIHPGQQLGYGGIVLPGQYFGWRHHAGLKTVVQRHQHGHQCHQRLAAAHISL